MPRGARAFGRMPRGDRWHKQLLYESTAPIADVRPPVLRPETVCSLDELREFRHFFRVQSGVELRTAELCKNADLVPTAWRLFQDDLLRFVTLLESISEG
jgi:hypothetical protein